MLIQETAILAVATTRPVPRVDEVMTPDPRTLPARASVNDAMMLLRHENIRHVPVLDERGKLVGMVSDRDLLGFPLPPLAGDGPLNPLRSPVDVTLDAAMSRQPQTCRPDAPLLDALRTLLTLKVGALPVVAEDGTLVGILTTVDILTWLEARLAA